MAANSSRTCPADIAKARGRWDRQASALRWLTYTLASISIVASITLAASLEFGWRSVLAGVAAISTGVLSTMQLPARSNRMRNAWRQLDIEVKRYESGRDSDDEEALERLLSVHAESEMSIGGMPDRFGEL